MRRSEIPVIGYSRTPLSPEQRAILRHPESPVDSHDDGFSRETAVTHLATHNIEEAVAHEQIETLLPKGYLYAVDGVLRMPSRRYE